MRRTWTIGRKLYTGVGALVMLLLGAGGVAWWVAASLHGELSQLAEVTAKRVALGQMLADRAGDVTSAERRFLLAAYRKDTARVEASRQELDDAVRKFQQTVDTLRPMLFTDESVRAIESADRAMKAWRPVNREVQQLIAARRLTDGSRLSVEQGNPLLDTIDEHATVIETRQRQHMAEAVAAAGAQYRLSRWLMIGVQILSFLVAGLVVHAVWRISVALRVRATALRDGAEGVVSAASQVAGSSQSLSQGANDQAASLEETSASMEEMASMTRQNAENSHQAADLMNEVDRRVSESNSALAAMVSSMTGIQQSSAKVAKIIKTIDEIAFQTNILALNAAVEAARAGQAGMGFAVVADEVRSLAQRSAQAARDTADLIEEASTNAVQGSRTVQQVAGTITGITESVSKAKGLVEQVSVASRQQAQGIDQVTQSIAQMEKVTQTTAATAEESAAASEELNAQAETALSIVAEVEAMVGGPREEIAVPRAAPPPAPTRETASPRDVGSVTRMRPRQARAARPKAPPRSRLRTAEEEIPLETGTYGRF